MMDLGSWPTANWFLEIGGSAGILSNELVAVVRRRVKKFGAT
jgi:hypothetical protein